MSLQDTGPRIALAVSVALLLFLVAFFIARGGSSEAALTPVREQPLAPAASVEPTRLRALGTVPALPRPRPPKPRRTSPPPPPPVSTPPPANVPAPPPPPAAPEFDDCRGEAC
jgi:hypothetical protein